jgi:hypothetical protein
MKNILDPKFRYIPAAQTDIRKTFARIRKELAQQGSTGTAPAKSLGVVPAAATPIRRFA